jgi:hypothetical protein
MNKNASPSEIAEAIRSMADDDIRNYRMPLRIEFYLNEIWTDAVMQKTIIVELLARNVMDNGIPVGIHARVKRDENGHAAQLYLFHASFPNPLEVRLPLLRRPQSINCRAAAFMTDLSPHSMIHPFGIEKSASRN